MNKIIITEVKCGTDSFAGCYDSTQDQILITPTPNEKKFVHTFFHEVLHSLADAQATLDLNNHSDINHAANHISAHLLHNFLINTKHMKADLSILIDDNYVNDSSFIQPLLNEKSSHLSFLSTIDSPLILTNSSFVESCLSKLYPKSCIKVMCKPNSDDVGVWFDRLTYTNKVLVLGDFSFKSMLSLKKSLILL